MRRPHFIAAQSSHPRGFLGKIIAWRMASETFADNAIAVENLCIRKGDRVIEIGCGAGTMLGLIERNCAGGDVVGIDPSAVMAGNAIRRNARAIEAGKIKILQAQVESLPRDIGLFDKALCSHVIYFWDDLQNGLNAIAERLVAGGRLSILTQLKGLAGTRDFPASIYRFYSENEILTALQNAGLQTLSVNSLRSGGPVVISAEKAMEAAGELPPRI